MSTRFPLEGDAILLAFTSFTVGILGYAIDARLGHRLPWWWAKLAIPLPVGFGLGLLLYWVGLDFKAPVILLLLASIGGTYALLRRR